MTILHLIIEEGSRKREVKDKVSEQWENKILEETGVLGIKSRSRGTRGKQEKANSNAGL